MAIDFEWTSSRETRNELADVIEETLPNSSSLALPITLRTILIPGANDLPTPVVKAN